MTEIDVRPAKLPSQRLAKKGKQRAVAANRKDRSAISLVSDDGLFPDIPPYNRPLNMRALPRLPQNAVFRPLSPPAAPFAMRKAAEALMQLARGHGQSLSMSTPVLYCSSPLSRTFFPTNTNPSSNAGPSRPMSPLRACFSTPTFMISAHLPPTHPFASTTPRLHPAGRRILERAACVAVTPNTELV